MTQLRYLTKSRFSLAVECPTKLDYKDHPAYSSTKLENDFLLALAEGGHQVGALAKCLFPDGIEVDEKGHDASVARTAELLQRDEVTLFEAAVRVGRLFIRIDLLRKTRGQLELYEVKAKGFDPANPGIVGARGGFLAGMKPYLYDVAFQRHVLRKAFRGMPIRSHLVMPNKQAVSDEGAVSQRLRIVKDGRSVHIDIDPSLRDGALAWRLLAVVPLDEHLDALQAQPLELGRYTTEFEEGISELERRLDTEPYAPRPGGQCKACEFRASALQLAAGKLDGRNRCLGKAYRLTPEQIASGTVLDLHQSRRTEAMLEEGKVLLTDLEPEDVRLAEEQDRISTSHRQWLQAEEARAVVDSPIARREALSQALDGLAWPLHFVDFETSRPALPFHPGRRPYEQLLFQFSHHLLDADGNLQHASQYLADEATMLPSFDTLRALRRALGGDRGSVLHWWDHEKTVLREVRDQLTKASAGEVPDRGDLVGFIDELLGTGDSPARLFDLGRHAHNAVFLPGTGGSSSLKKVLPALLSSSQRLRARYSTPHYGAAGGTPSLNFMGQAWVQQDGAGHLIDPYELLGRLSADADLAELDEIESEDKVIADGGAAMVAYGLLQSGRLDDASMRDLRDQLLRYCELDTLAMVMAWEGLQELC